MYNQRKGGLAFLSKKSWHTSTLQNQERVWLAEQAHEKEQKRIEQLRRDMEEMEQMRELRKLHDNAAGVQRPDRVDWMYEGPLAQAQGSAPVSAAATSNGGGITPQDAEAYLLGKEYKEPAGSQGSGAAQQATRVGALFGTTVDPERDAMAKIQEDPLLAIRRREQKSLQGILQNPVKMRNLVEEKTRELIKEWRERKDARKSEHKLAKSEKRIAKVIGKDKTGRARALVEELAPELAPKMKELAPPPPPPPPTPGELLAAARRQRMRQSQQPPQPQRRGEEKAPASESPHASASEYGDRYGLKVTEDGELPRRREKRSRSRSRSPSETAAAPYDAREHRRHVRESMRRMTDSDREKELERMKRDGERREEHKHRRYSRDEHGHDKERDEESSDKRRRADERPDFLAEMSSKVYGDDADVEDRLHRHRHHIQRRDLDSGGIFTK